VSLRPSGKLSELIGDERMEDKKRRKSAAMKFGAHFHDVPFASPFLPSYVKMSKKIHPRLALGREGGGGSGKNVETAKKTHLWLTFGGKGGGSGKHVENIINIHLWLAFGREGGGGGGKHIQSIEKIHLRLVLRCEEGGGCRCIETDTAGSCLEVSD